MLRIGQKKKLKLLSKNVEDKFKENFCLSCIIPYLYKNIHYNIINDII